MIRVIVVDDEPLAREELVRLIGEDKDFEIVAQAANGEEAIECAEKKNPDVIFLDIEMPRLTGLEVASRLTEWENPPLVVFATAYHRHAVEAFDMHAMDYVLKPYEPGRLKKTFERIKAHLETHASTREKLVSFDDYLIRKGTIKKLVGHARNTKDRIVIQPDEVLYFQARNTEVIARMMDNKEWIVNATLKEISAGLDPNQFAQTHKSYIVNLNKVEKVTPLFSGNFEIILKTSKSEKIPLSRRFARKIKSLLKTW